MVYYGPLFRVMLSVRTVLAIIKSSLSLFMGFFVFMGFFNVTIGLLSFNRPCFLDTCTDLSRLRLINIGKPDADLIEVSCFFILFFG